MGYSWCLSLIRVAHDLFLFKRSGLGLTLQEQASRLTKDEKRVIKKRIKEFEKTHDALRSEDPGYAKQRLSEWADKLSATADAAGWQFGPLVAYACTDIPPVARGALENDFAPGLRVHFHRNLRDSETLFRIFTVEIISEFREVISWWRNLDPDREAKLVEQVARTTEHCRRTRQVRPRRPARSTWRCSDYVW